MSIYILQEVFCKKDILKKFAKFTGTHLCQSLFLNTVERPATLLKKRRWHRCFPVNLANKIFYGTPPMAASDFKCK